jgi:ferric-dicitrate binding protein FerR (iron transport regulator)
MDEKLIDRAGAYCRGTLTESDAEELKAWLDSRAENRALFREAVSDLKVYGALSAVGKTAGSYRDLTIRMRRVKRRRVLVRLTAAATASAILLAAVVLMGDHATGGDADRIVPGTTRAILELADGHAIDLTQDNLAEVAARYGDFSVDERHGTIVYGAKHADREVMPHSITVPVGAEYRFTLSDGTRVWLNSDSRITYPSCFDGASRSVALQGEAFFDVAEDRAHPFVVEFGKARLEVTGTRFSISAYPELSLSTATLEEGGADVTYGGAQVSLTPGRQALIDKALESLASREVDTRLYTSWMDGVFEYENMKLSDIAVQLSRWYDVEFVFTARAAKESRFTGVVIKYQELNDALTLIEKTSDVGFVIDGRRITVTKR